LCAKLDELGNFVRLSGGGDGETCYEVKAGWPAFGISISRWEERNEVPASGEGADYLMPQQLALIAPVLRAAPPGALVVDCGMWWGEYTQAFLALNAKLRVWAFNPVASHRAWAARNLMARGFGGADVCIPPVELSSEPSTSYIGSNSGSGLLNWGVLDTATSNDQRVRVVSFRNWLASLVQAPGTFVTLVKLEAMGLEPQIVQCAADLLSAGSVRYLLVRSHEVADHESLKHTLLPSMGFDVTDLKYPNAADGRGLLFGVWRSGKSLRGA
jgi:hypothetical protein